jgi:CPA1 family monovalent cation:H+ antiporter
VSDPSIFIALSLLTPYAVYVLAEEVLHASGILAVVSYGLYRGWRDPSLFPNASTRLQNISFWNMLVFLLESLLFVLVGQQLPSILEGLSEYSVAQVLIYAALVYATLVGVRFLWFFTTPYLHPVFDRLLRNRYLGAPWQERLVMVWSGMRGGVSLAAALAVPLVTDTGESFPARDLILFLTFSVILATLVLQGLSLGGLIRSLRLRGDEEADALVELKGRLKAAQAALDRIEQIYNDEQVPLDAQERMREHYEERIRRYGAGLQAGGTSEAYAESSAAWRNWRRELLTAEREAIVSMRDRGQLPPEIMRRIQRDLDLEEARIGG